MESSSDNSGEHDAGFLASARDEVLAPVAVVLARCERLLGQSGGQPDDFAADLRRIQESGRRLRQLAAEVFDPQKLPFAHSEGFARLQSRVRHDMLNALNPIINYCEMWLEDAPQQGLARFLGDLREIHAQGRRCLAVLDRVLKSKGASGRETHVVAALPGPIPGAEGGRFLVVDDEADNRDILCRMLVRQGHQPSTAENGMQALEQLRGRKFDVVLLDVRMPVMDGYATLQAIKADEELRELPVIMISASGDADLCIRCIALGAEDYLPKPFNPMLLQARINACLEKKRFHDREKDYLEQIERERRRADELLHVILPPGVVAELKANNAVQPRRYEGVAVLFADIAGFTPYCDGHDPVEVVHKLQDVVEAWEEIAQRHAVEKIKTIGDAFMAASGLLERAANPVLNCIRCGQEMIAATRVIPGWDLRVGIHLGAVVAGVIGRRQYLFDLWGDTVNTAARMESHGIPGAITLSRAAWDRVAADCDGEPLFVTVKGKGKLEMVRFKGFLR
jgi:CheY-like chemotaxis protein/class 3 adenylate cyclase